MFRLELKTYREMMHVHTVSVADMCGLRGLAYSRLELESLLFSKNFWIWCKHHNYLAAMCVCVCAVCVCMCVSVCAVCVCMCVSVCAVCLCMSVCVCGNHVCQHLLQCRSSWVAMYVAGKYWQLLLGMCRVVQLYKIIYLLQAKCVVFLP